MNRYKAITNTTITALLILAFSFTAFANSSWVWISETRPYDVLPFVAIATLIIETAALNLILKTGNWHKVFSGVLIGNLISFAVPYIGYSNTPPYYDMPLSYILERGPFYTVGAAFLFLTVAVELPFIYFWLKKDVKNKKLLVLVTVVANVVTTAMVALVERLLCEGYYA
ncbi:MAG: hypothetical protein IKB12_00605 [Clostridia bacterium]|nr:hypothetical protein [Clostridia bacterium]